MTLKNLDKAINNKLNSNYHFLEEIFIILGQFIEHIVHTSTILSAHLKLGTRSFVSLWCQIFRVSGTISILHIHVRFVTFFFFNFERFLHLHCSLEQNLKLSGSNLLASSGLARCTKSQGLLFLRNTSGADGADVTRYSPVLLACAMPRPRA